MSIPHFRHFGLKYRKKYIKIEDKVFWDNQNGMERNEKNGT